MADEKAGRSAKKKKRKGRRRKFSSVTQVRAQLEGITAAQERYRRAKRRRRANDKVDATATESERIIVESREKSEQAWKNALRNVQRPEDLDGFD